MSALQVFWKNIVGNGEIARNEQFLLFPQCFLPVWRSFVQFSTNLKLYSANSFILEQLKKLSFGKGLNKKGRKNAFSITFVI